MHGIVFSLQHVACPINLHLYVHAGLRNPFSYPAIKYVTQPRGIMHLIMLLIHVILCLCSPCQIPCAASGQASVLPIPCCNTNAVSVPVIHPLAASGFFDVNTEGSCSIALQQGGHVQPFGIVDSIAAPCSPSPKHACPVTAMPLVGSAGRQSWMPWQA